MPGLAVTLIENALRVVLKNADYHNNLGNALLALDRLDEAAQAFGSASKLRSHDAGAHINLGSTLGRMDHHEEALEALNEACNSIPIPWTVTATSASPCRRGADWTMRSAPSVPRLAPIRATP